MHEAFKVLNIFLGFVIGFVTFTKNVINYVHDAVRFSIKKYVSLKISLV